MSASCVLHQTDIAVHLCLRLFSENITKSCAAVVCMTYQRRNVNIIIYHAHLLLEPQLSVEHWNNSSTFGSKYLSPHAVIPVFILFFILEIFQVGVGFSRTSLLSL